MQPCPRCKGTGERDDIVAQQFDYAIPCPLCKGEGQIKTPKRRKPQ